MPCVWVPPSNLTCETYPAHWLRICWVLRCRFHPASRSSFWVGAASRQGLRRWKKGCQRFSGGGPEPWPLCPSPRLLSWKKRLWAIHGSAAAELLRSDRPPTEFNLADTRKRWGRRIQALCACLEQSALGELLWPRPVVSCVERIFREVTGTRPFQIFSVLRVV